MTADTPRRLYELFCDAFNRSDQDALAALFEDDALLLEPRGVKLVHGRDAIAAAVMEYVKISHITAHNIDVLETGDLAIVYATRTVELAPPRGERQERVGITTDVFRRQPDGRWLIAIDNPNGTEVTSVVGREADVRSG